jgi:hypothetical protein
MTLNTPKTIDALSKIFDLVYDDGSCLNTQKYFEPLGKSASGEMYKLFQNNQSLFMWIRMGIVEYMRGMDSDFGILPIPKYDEAQSNYIQTVNPFVGVVTTVPQSAKDISASGAVLEYMAYISKSVLQPAYYDVVLHGKIARDEESSEMLNIIFANRVYDLGDIFDFGGLGNDVIMMSMNYDKNIVSKYAEKESAALTDINTLAEKFKSIK